ncbi:stage III sporulation protein AF [Paenibacillus chondroitinus]|uniref:Stage III sporulation protein AF n=1 Tax=Paenibacillus chondroitinus TaxID=59842 RepID=A0ABU6DPR9_9BACL|nr:MULTISPECIES: stage III sporulation protein AF [Paenibacillus]MCY9657001.1 stage III sporulation protein AF [Paenibacillus anseongense]MEB4798797.1 stage III sporulation protein AF [Paenibacillus chondroitinus]
MDWLGGWLKTVIMVIMLATFVDLLLPSNTMQRYVKTVMSLFILLTLLTPVLQLFQKDWDVDQLLSQAEKQQNEKTMLASGSGGSSWMKSLDVITKDAQKLQAAGQEQSQQMIQTQLAGLMKEDIQKQTDLTVHDVQVVAQIDNNGKPAITKVRVTLDDIEVNSKSSPTAGSKSIAAMEPVKPIDPIRIKANEKEMAASAQASAPYEQEVERLKQGITRNWLVEPERIDIQVEQRNGRIAR